MLAPAPLERLARLRSERPPFSTPPPHQASSAKAATEARGKAGIHAAVVAAGATKAAEATKAKCLVFIALGEVLISFGAILTRLRTRTGNLAAAGVAAFGMLFRAIAVMVVVFAVAVSDKWVGLAAALTYAAGYSAALGLQLVAYYSNPKAGAAA